jgi:hypothetical protein
MKLGLILGMRCNASCTHCSYSSGPYRTESLNRELALRAMDEAAAAIGEGESLNFLLTGGEPFLDFEFLLEVVSHGAKLGGYVNCVTNAYWAKTDEVATEMLSRLHDAGLSALAVSVSRFHQQYVPLHRARRALQVAASLGMQTELKGVVTNEDLEPGGTLHEWKSSLDADTINIFPVLPSLRDGAALPEGAYYRVPGLPSEPCPGEVLTLYYNGIARSCCFPPSTDRFLTIGDARSQPIADLLSRLRDGARQRILREHGPIHFAKAAMDAGLGDRLRDSYAGPCDLCEHIRNDPALRRVAETVSAIETFEE